MNDSAPQQIKSPDWLINRAFCLVGATTLARRSTLYHTQAIKETLVLFLTAHLSAFNSIYVLYVSELVSVVHHVPPDNS